MNKHFTLLTFFVLSALAGICQTANDTIWKKGLFVSANINQVSFSNWAAGGENSVAINGFLNSYANYKKDNVIWDNNLDLSYGLNQIGDEDLKKNEDRIEYTGKLGYAVNNSKKWYYTALLNIKTQFTNGYDYTNENPIVISRFAAPAFTVFSLGIDYKPSEHLSAYLSPISNKNTFVLDDVLSNQGAYGVDSGKTIRSEMGAYLNVRYKQEVIENITLTSQLDLFSNYLEDPQNVDLNFTLMLVMKVNKYITANFSTQFIYDDNTPISVYEGSGSQKKLVGVGPRLQSKQVFGVGLGYKITKSKLAK
jgi:hypothetical protein